MSERFRCRRIEYDSARIERTTIVGGLLIALATAMGGTGNGEPACLLMKVGIFNAEIS